MFHGGKFHIFHISCDNCETFMLITSGNTVNSTSASAPLQNFSASIKIYMQYSKLSYTQNIPINDIQHWWSTNKPIKAFLTCFSQYILGPQNHHTHEICD